MCFIFTWKVGFIKGVYEICDRITILHYYLSCTQIITFECFLDKVTETLQTEYGKNPWLKTVWLPSRNWTMCPVIEFYNIIMYQLIAGQLTDCMLSIVGRKERLRWYRWSYIQYFNRVYFQNIAHCSSLCWVYVGSEVFHVHAVGFPIGELECCQ